MNQMGRMPMFIGRFFALVVPPANAGACLKRCAGRARHAGGSFLPGRKLARQTRVGKLSQRELEARGTVLDWNAYIPPSRAG